jgi:Na+/H+ antiporter NhaD/arsenite permease-like protein
MHWTALIVFLITYLLIAFQNLPKLHIDRPAGALLGAVAMVLFGVVTLQEAYQAIDLNTILFLLGMMIIVAYLELSGFFELIEIFIVRRARTRQELLFLVIVSSGILSAFFMNDTICLMFAPLLLQITQRLQINPAPYLIALATAANIGSTMTFIGNPQNMLIGLRSEISFLEFMRILAPVSLIGLVIDYYLIRWIYKREFNSEALRTQDELFSPSNVQKGLLGTSLLAMLGFLVLLSLGMPPPSVAISLASLLILAASSKPRKALQEVDWPLLLFFSGLFVVMSGVQKSGLIDAILLPAQGFFTQNLLTSLINISLISTLLSNLVSNVPAVLLLSPLFESSAESKTAWVSLAMSSTLAGNLTIIGSVANIIVFEIARARLVTVGWLEYCKVGIPLTILTILVGIISIYFWH